MQSIAEMLYRCGTDQGVLPPTALYNEGWLLRLVLNVLSEPAFDGDALAPFAGASWFSEGLLPSAFLHRFRGDPLAEGWTHADAVVGHVKVSRVGGRAEVSLADQAKQFVVAEAKLASPLSPGTRRATTYNQAARNVACMAEVLGRSDRDPASFQSLAFFVIAPARQIGPVVLPHLLEKEQIRLVVEQRVEMYALEPERDAMRAWFTKRFLPVLDAVRVEAITWENLIEQIAKRDPAIASQLDTFYVQCCRFNPLLPC